MSRILAYRDTDIVCRVLRRVVSIVMRGCTSISFRPQFRMLSTVYCETCTLQSMCNLVVPVILSLVRQKVHTNYGFKDVGAATNFSPY